MFKKLSLTHQVLTMICLFLVAFCAFFFLFLSGNIDKAISNQMYGMMANQQSSIISYMNANQNLFKEEVYSYMLMDSLQTDCLIHNQQITVLGPSGKEENHPQFFTYLIQEANRMQNNHLNELHGNIEVSGEIYYYRMEYCLEDQPGSVILASYMDDDYAQSLRKSLIDSTIYVTVIAFLVIFLIIMIWVFSVITPLNQIKNYIEQIKQGKEVELHLNRDDEIGEVANALVTMNEELRKQEKAKEEMIHNISHDLKTPIATIKSYSESIKDGIYPYGTLEASVDVIYDNAQRLEDKVHSLLYLNRIEYIVTSDAEGVVTNMKDVVEQVVLNLKVIRPEIKIITEVEEVFFDGLLESWRVAIENIMDNAFRYAKTYIRIQITENDLRIYNDGVQMPEDRIESLFRPYEKGEGGRFGLGLSIVSKVCKANHYNVVGFNTDDGVCFRIYRNPVNEKKRINDRRKKDSVEKWKNKGENV